MQNQPSNPPEAPADAGAPASPGAAPAARAESEARASKRLIAGGRVVLESAGNSRHEGRIYDVSPTGASLLLDARLPVGSQWTLHMHIYKSGQHYRFSLHGHVIYATLSGGAGFRHGLALEKPGGEASATLQALLANPT